MYDAIRAGPLRISSVPLLAPPLQVAASAAAEAAAALAAWEQAEAQPPAGGYGYAPADQQQQQLEYEEEYFEEEEEEEEGFYDPYRPFKLLLAGGARWLPRARVYQELPCVYCCRGV